MDFPMMPIDEKLLSMQGLNEMPSVDYFSSFASPQLDSRKELHKELFYGKQNTKFETQLLLSARSTFDKLQQQQELDDEAVEPKMLGDEPILPTRQSTGIGLVVSGGILAFMSLISIITNYNDGQYTTFDNVILFFFSIIAIVLGVLAVKFSNS